MFLGTMTNGLQWFTEQLQSRDQARDFGGKCWDVPIAVCLRKTTCLYLNKCIHLADIIGLKKRDLHSIDIDSLTFIHKRFQ